MISRGISADTRPIQECRAKKVLHSVAGVAQSPVASCRTTAIITLPILSAIGVSLILSSDLPYAVGSATFKFFSARIAGMEPAITAGITPTHVGKPMSHARRSP